MFKAISIGLAVLVIVMLELLLRAFHYGHDLRLFIEAPADNRYLVLNPDASKKYFLNQRIATTGNSELFKKEKDKHTCRIFVLGESTTIGYPYYHNGAFHRWLQYRLMHSFPDRDFEIINLSLTAVNSFTVLGFAREVVRYQPDAVLIYTGHNEFYGSLGVGSTERIAGNPHLVNLVLALREYKIMQLLTNTYEKILSRTAGPEATAGKARMELMVAAQQIPYGSTLYNRGIAQFQANMDATLQLLDKKGIPVFISNLVSNEKDLKPFISLGPDSVQAPAFQRTYTAALQALERKDTTTAFTGFRQAEKLYNGYAATHYYLGRLLLVKGDTARARQELSTARDLDALRFRAPAALNNIIPQLCSKYRNAHLVNAKAAFEQLSVDHIIGNELLLEHVHPNLQGYAVLSDAFYNSMQQAGFFPKDSMNLAQLLRTMPITRVDSLAGAYRIANLKRSWPFTTVPVKDALAVNTEEERLAYGLAFQHTYWPAVMDTLYNYYAGKADWAGAAAVVETLVLEHPADAPLYERAANLYGKLNDFNNAAFYFRKAFALAPTFEMARTLFVLYLKMDQPLAAMPYLDYAMQHNDHGLNLAPVKQLTAEIIQLQQTTTPEALNPVVNKYRQMGNNEGAASYLEKLLKTDPGNKQALLLLGEVRNRR